MRKIKQNRKEADKDKQQIFQQSTFFKYTRRKKQRSEISFLTNLKIFCPGTKDSIVGQEKGALDRKKCII